MFDGVVAAVQADKTKALTREVTTAPVAESRLQITEPDLVIAAVRQVVEAARRDSSVVVTPDRP